MSSNYVILHYVQCSTVHCKLYSLSITTTSCIQVRNIICLSRLLLYLGLIGPCIELQIVCVICLCLMFVYLCPVLWFWDQTLDKHLVVVLRQFTEQTKRLGRGEIQQRKGREKEKNGKNRKKKGKNFKKESSKQEKFKEIICNYRKYLTQYKLISN